MTIESTTWAEAAQASEVAHPPERKTVRRLCRVKLPARAREDLTVQLLQEMDDEKALKAERKSVCADLRERLETCATRIAGFHEALKSGVAVEECEVYERFDPDTGRTELVALDGTILESADVDAGGRQLTLADAARNGSNGHAADDSDSGDLEDEEDGDLGEVDEDSPDLEDRLDRALAAGDEDSAPEVDAADAPSGELPAWTKETTPYEGRKVEDDDEPSAGDTVIIDPASILEAAAEADADEDTSADAPKAKRARRGKKS